MSAAVMITFLRWVVAAPRPSEIRPSDGCRCMLYESARQVSVSAASPIRLETLDKSVDWKRWIRVSPRFAG